MRYYLVTVGSKNTGLLTSKRKAISFAKKNAGVVHRASVAGFDGGRVFGIDAPTFRAVRDVVGDFRSSMVKKIISGGQTGADQGGLVAGKQLGLATGGWMPKGFLTEAGLCPALAVYGLVETSSVTYPPRTRLNAQWSDGTAWFGKTGSVGYHCTENACNKFKRSFRVITTAQELRDFVTEFNIQTLNVAGNRESKNPGIHRFTAETIIEAFK